MTQVQQSSPAEDHEFELLERRKAHLQPARNEYGLDVDYFTRAINRDLSDVRRYRPDELARVLMRLAVTADKSVLNESEFLELKNATNDT